MLWDIEPGVRARVRQLVDQVGEAEFRHGVAQFTGWDIESMLIDEVIGLYVMARRGRVHRPDVGRRAAALHMTLPDRTEDDAGFSVNGQRVSAEEWVERRTARLAESHVT